MGSGTGERVMPVPIQSEPTDVFEVSTMQFEEAEDKEEEIYIHHQVPKNIVAQGTGEMDLVTGLPGHITITILILGTSQQRIWNFVGHSKQKFQWSVDIMFIPGGSYWV